MSNRNHFWREEAFECGEGPTCSWIPIAAAVISAAASAYAAKQQNKQQQQQAQQVGQANAEAALPHFNPLVEPYVQDIMGGAQGIYNQGGFAPPVNELQLLGRQNTLGYTEEMMPGLIGQAQGAWAQALSGEMNPYVQQMIDATNKNLSQDFQRNTLPYLSGQASAAGGYGGGRHQVNEGIAAEGLAEAQANAATNLLFNAYNTGQQTSMQAQQMAPTMAQLGLLPSQTQMNVGGMYQQDAMNPATNLQGYAGMINPYATQGSGGTPYTIPQLQNPITQAIGGGMAGYGLANQWLGSPNPQVSAGQAMTASNVGNYQGIPPSEFRTWM